MTATTTAEGTGHEGARACLGNLGPWVRYLVRVHLLHGSSAPVPLSGTTDAVTDLEIAVAAAPATERHEPSHPVTRAGQHPTDVPGVRRVGSRETARIHVDRKDGSMKTTPQKRVHS
jgi:hypothetical protein